MDISRTEILRMIGGLGWIAVLAIVGTDRGILRRLRGADSPERAVSLSTAFALRRARIARFKSAGAIRETQDGRLYLDAAGLAEYRRRKRARAVTVLGVVVPALLVVWWFLGQRR